MRQRRRQRVTCILGRRQAERFLAQRAIGRHVPALQDRPEKQPARERTGHQRNDAERARRFAGNRDLSGIAPERADVVANPAQRLDLIEKPVVALDSR